MRAFTFALALAAPVVGAAGARAPISSDPGGARCPRIAHSGCGRGALGSVLLRKKFQLDDQPDEVPPDWLDNTASGIAASLLRLAEHLHLPPSLARTGPGRPIPPDPSIAPLLIFVAMSAAALMSALLFWIAKKGDPAQSHEEDVKGLSTGSDHLDIIKEGSCETMVTDHTYTTRALDGEDGGLHKATGSDDESEQTALPSLKDAFDVAVSWAQSLPEDGPLSATNSERLALYGLFKQATAGDNTSPQPAMRGDSEVANLPEARYKWVAWDRNKGKDAESAMKEYVEYVETVKAKNKQ